MDTNAVDELIYILSHFLFIVIVIIILFILGW